MTDCPSMNLNSQAVAAEKKGLKANRAAGTMDNETKVVTTPRERHPPPEPRPRQPPPEPRRATAHPPPQPRERQAPPQPRERQAPPPPKPKKTDLPPHDFQ